MMKMKSRFLKHNAELYEVFKRKHQEMRDKVQDRVQRDCNNNKFYIVE